MIHVQIVDDHKILVEGLQRIINETGIAEVTGIYYNLNSCRKGLTRERPDVLLLDIELPDGNGIDFCEEMIHLYPDLKIMMLTTFNEFSIAKRSLHNGALGYVLKNSTGEEILAGIETVNTGETFLCENIDLLMKKKKNDELIFLTNREKEVLQLTAIGLTGNEIAEKLFISQETVKGYKKDLLLKFGAKNSVALVTDAIRKKMVDL
jgi:DNA-binding NarL/FixJ family response regulator